MDIGSELIDQIYSWLEQQRDCSQKLSKLARELETYRERANISQTVGSTVAVAGSAAMLGAGILTLCTAGAAVPLLAAAGSVYTGVGLATSLVSTFVEAFISSSNMKDAEEIAKKATDLEKEIQRLIELLIKEGEKEERKASARHNSNPESYVMVQIQKAMAQRCGVKWHDNFMIQKNMSDWSKGLKTSGKEEVQRLLGSSTLGLPLVSKFLIKFMTKAVVKEAGRTTGKAVMAKGIARAAASLGTKAVIKGVARVGGGAVGLVFGIPEMIDNWKDLVKNNSVTKASQSLRDTARNMKTSFDIMKRELHDIRQTFEKLAKINHIIENLGQNSNHTSEDVEELIEFVMENCEDEATWKWLKEDSDSDFLKLVEMFHFLKKSIDKEDESDHSKDVDIIFVAHGSMGDSMIPASCLMPFDTIKDVILYSPWNCYISADAAYGVAAGFMKPHHRKFVCTGCEFGRACSEKRHHPSNLPNEWNSMKKAESQQIPNIMVGPLGPKDGAWEKIEVLKNEHGHPERNRIVIPYIISGSDESSLGRVPFSIVTLALSLVLIHSRFRATIHLAACLGRGFEVKEADEAHLKRQYAYTIDNTYMTASASMLLDAPLSKLYKAFIAFFGSVSSMCQ